MGDLLDVHATCRRSNNHDALSTAIHHVGQIELSVDFGCLFNVEARNDFPLWPGLHGGKTLAQQFVSRLPQLQIVAAQFDTAGLAARAQ